MLPWVGKDVVQMIYAIKMESSVWIARPAVPAGVHQVATQSHVSHWRSAFRFSANMGFLCVLKAFAGYNTLHDCVIK